MRESVNRAKLYVRFLQPRRWLTLYEEGVFALQTKALNENSLATIQKLLPEDLLVEVLFATLASGLLVEGTIANV